MDYIEKLRIVYDIYLDGLDCSISEEEINEVEKELGLTLPIPLKEFYLVFGACEELLKSNYAIALPNELYQENNILYFAAENQGVCNYGVNIYTHELTYIDKNQIEPMEEELDDFLLYLLALQGSEFLPCAGVIYDELSEVEEHLSKLTRSINTPVFYDVKGLIGCYDGENVVFAGTDEDTFDQFVDESDLTIDYL